MNYKFKCTNCKRTELIDIPMHLYDSVKNKQYCSKCGAKSDRVIEWKGLASGHGEGWFGKSDGCKAI